MTEKMKIIKNSLVIFFISIFFISTSTSCANKVNKKPIKTETVKQGKVKKDIPSGNNVWMKNLAFVPKVKKIKAGTTVTWLNKDVAMHTVHTGTPEKPLPMIASKTLGKGEQFSFTFNKKGTYKYFCTTHPTIMQATIIVE